MEEFSLFIEERKEEKEEIGTGTLTRVRCCCGFHPLFLYCSSTLTE